MIPECERAQILERSRRGKRHRAMQGEVSVLSGAPYGCRCVRKTEDRTAYYEVLDARAEVVRQDLCTTPALSIGAITRRPNESGYRHARNNPGSASPCPRCSMSAPSSATIDDLSRCEQVGLRAAPSPACLRLGGIVVSNALEVDL